MKRNECRHLRRAHLRLVSQFSQVFSVLGQDPFLGYTHTHTHTHTCSTYPILLQLNRRCTSVQH